MTNYIARGRQVVIPLTNKSGGAVAAGDVVILSSGTAAAFTTTTSAGQSADWVGVVYDASIAGDAVGNVILNGYVPLITLSGAASLGDYVETHSVAKQAAPTGTRSAGAFGQVLGTGTTPAAYIWGVPDAISASGAIATDTIWDAAGDLVQGTGADAAARLAIGTANQLLRTNSGATAAEWAGVGRVLISEQTPTGTGTVTWSSIPATYKSLEIESVCRSTAAAQTDTISIAFNNDTTAANYRNIGHYGANVSTTGAGGADSNATMAITGGSATAGYAAQIWIKISDYAGTAFHKSAQFVAGRRDGTSQAVVYNAFTQWENTGAINRVDLILTSGNYDTGSTFRLYGVY